MTTQRLNNTATVQHFDANDDETILLPAPAQPAPMVKKGTGRFAKPGWATVEELVGHPSGDGFPTGDFTLVPAHMAHKAYEPGTLRWWLELWPDRAGKPLRLEIVGDVVIGRSSAADIDLMGFNAVEHGISRRHAML